MDAQDGGIPAKKGMVAHNRRVAEVWPLGAASTFHRSAPVEKLNVSTTAAQQLGAYLTKHWVDSSLPLYDLNGKVRARLSSFSMYDNTVAPHNPKLQSLHAVLIASNQIEPCRFFMAGFGAIEYDVLDHARAWCAGASRIAHLT